MGKLEEGVLRKLEKEMLIKREVWRKRRYKEK